MPEFPEISVQVAYLQERVLDWQIDAYGSKGKRQFKNIPDEDKKKTLDAFWRGNTIEGVYQRGKYVVIHTERGICTAHLMLQGRLSVKGDPLIANYEAWKSPPDPKRVGMWLKNDDGEVLNFHTPRYLAHALVYPDVFDASEVPSLAALGPEVLVTDVTDPSFEDHGWTRSRFEQVSARKAIPIKALLLDQHSISGIGNVVACEALYRAGVSPHRPAKSLTSDELEGVFEATQEVIGEAIDSGLDRGAYAQIYKKTHDSDGEEVRSEKIKRRDTYWVPSRQT